MAVHNKVNEEYTTWERRRYRPGDIVTGSQCFRIVFYEHITICWNVYLQFCHSSVSSSFSVFRSGLSYQKIPQDVAGLIVNVSSHVILLLCSLLCSFLISFISACSVGWGYILVCTEDCYTNPILAVHRRHSEIQFYWDAEQHRPPPDYTHDARRSFTGTSSLSNWPLWHSLVPPQAVLLCKVYQFMLPSSRKKPEHSTAPSRKRLQPRSRQTRHGWCSSSVGRIKPATFQCLSWCASWPNLWSVRNSLVVVHGDISMEMHRPNGNCNYVVDAVIITTPRYTWKCRPTFARCSSSSCESRWNFGRIRWIRWTSCQMSFGCPRVPSKWTSVSHKVWSELSCWSSSVQNQGDICRRVRCQLPF